MTKVLPQEKGEGQEWHLGNKYSADGKEPMIKKKKNNRFITFIKQIISIKVILSALMVILILLSTITILVVTYTLQVNSIDTTSKDMGSLVEYETLEFVKNQLFIPFASADGFVKRVQKNYKMTTDPTTWKMVIDDMQSVLYNFPLSYFSFTSKDDYSIGMINNYEKKSVELEIYYNGYYYTNVPIVNDSYTVNLSDEKREYEFSLSSMIWWTIPFVNKKAQWSEIYATSQNVTWLTAYYPSLTKSGDLDFVVTADYAIPELRKFLKTIRISDNSFVYLIESSSSNMIASSVEHDTLYNYDRTYSPYKIRKLKLSQSSIPEVALIGKDLEKKYGTDLKTKNIVKNEKYFANGKGYILAVSDFKDSYGLDWKILIMISLEDFMGPINTLRNVVLIVDAVVLVGSVILSVLLGNFITVPLDKLGKEMNKIRQAKHVKFNKYTGIFYEVQVLQKHFSTMTNALDGFMKYVPVEIVSSFIQGDESSFELGVSPRKMAVLFSDIKNFTTICETLHPNQLISILGKYFELTSAAVYRNRGVLDKYIGDSLMALFGAPEYYEEYDLFCCHGAFEIQLALKEYNQSLSLQGLPTLYTRVGCASGEILVGNIGSTYRYSYTVLGDNVNLASRLEALNKQYGTNIMISESCYNSVKDDFLLRFIDTVAVKGKSKGIRVYQIVARKSLPKRVINDSTSLPKDIDSYGITPELERYCDWYNNIMNLYLKKKFNEAEEEFSEFAKQFSGDYAAQVMAERCREFKRSPPPSDWSGVYIATEK
ncbi:hypothetical protein ABK040_016183 [Willaertia magna]